MKLQAFSIFDEKSGVFGLPFFTKNKGMALRSFSDLVKDQNTSIFRHPDDFKLYLIGDFDDVSGELSHLAQPEFVAHAGDFINDK